MELHVVGAKDWRVWKQARLRALADAADAFGASLSEWESADDDRWRQRLADVPFNLVAVEGDVVVGQASGTDVDGANRIELISMWVAPTARGAGVADDLVNAVADFGRRVGADAVRLSVRRANDRAIRFYQRVGFEVANEPGDEPAELAMVKPLRT